jgi:hypothetical protein
MQSEISNNQFSKSITEKDIELEKLKNDLNVFEKEIKIKIENIYKEKDNHIVEKQALAKNLKELEAE